VFTARDYQVASQPQLQAAQTARASDLDDMTALLSPQLSVRDLIVRILAGNRRKIGQLGWKHTA
jgi:hypothetical protein